MEDSDGLKRLGEVPTTPTVVATARYRRGWDQTFEPDDDDDDDDGVD